MIFVTPPTICIHTLPLHLLPIFNLPHLPFTPLFLNPSSVLTLPLPPQCNGTSSPCNHLTRSDALPRGTRRDRRHQVLHPVQGGGENYRKVTMGDNHFAVMGRIHLQTELLQPHLAETDRNGPCIDKGVRHMFFSHEQLVCGELLYAMNLF